MSVRGCEFAQSSWGPQVGKAVGEWALVCTDEWGSGSGWYSLAGCYDSPLPPQASSLFTRIESSCTLTLARAHTDTHRHAHALQHLPDTEARGREVRWVAELGRKTKRRNESQKGVHCRVCIVAVYSVLRQSVAKKTQHFFCNSIKKWTLQRRVTIFELLGMHFILFCIKRLHAKPLFGQNDHTPQSIVPPRHLVHTVSAEP